MTTTIVNHGEEELFDKIDGAIESFKKNEGARKGIKVSRTQLGAWLNFKWRQLTWSLNEINYLIEIYPHFNGNEEITGWNLYAAAWYDHDKKRYYLNKSFAEKESLYFISENAESLILKSYLYISEIKKEQIPFAVDLK